MRIFNELLQNRILLVSIFSFALAQALKVVFQYITTRKIDLSLLTSAGGMPSSHSAFVCSMTVMVGASEGFYSPFFAISFMTAVVVMYDAAGVRRAAGQHAMVLNQLVKQAEEKNPADKIDFILKELLGHTPFQVIMGAALGLLIAILFSIENFY